MRGYLLVGMDLPEDDGDRSRTVLAEAVAAVANGLGTRQGYLTSATVDEQDVPVLRAIEQRISGQEPEGVPVLVTPDEAEQLRG